MRGNFGGISNGRGIFNFILTLRVKSNDKLKLRVFLTLFPHIYALILIFACSFMFNLMESNSK